MGGHNVPPQAATADAVADALANWRDKPTVTADETAEILRLGRNSTYEGIANGEIPSIRVGRRVLVPTASLRRLLGEV